MKFQFCLNRYPYTIYLGELSIFNRIFLYLPSFKLVVFHVEITSIADLPSGTGLGSSGAFSVALIQALSIYTKKTVKNVAELAYQIEREKLGNPVGKQDQYSAMLGGFRFYTATKQGDVYSTPINLETKQIVTGTGYSTYSMLDNMYMYYTGVRRKASKVLSKVEKSEEQLLQIRDIVLVLGRSNVY